MWRRTYLLLILVRLYFAFSPSYIHPDENFQGPEVIAGQIFDYPVHLTWEFTSVNPIRSVFPLWPVYGLPMLLLRWVWTETGQEKVEPTVTFYTLRGLMFVLSLVLEDWAIHELVQSPRRRREAVVLVASSYVTWTYQTHTFSNAVETLLVAWSLVLIQRIVENKQRSSIFSSGLLAFLFVFGLFNRITFPAFVLIPGLRVLPHFFRKPLSLISFSLFAFLTTILAITTDTAFYNSRPLTLRTLLHNPTITPLNNLLYNAQSSNLALHGLHPYYQHLFINLPQLLGPAIPLLFFLTPSLRPPHLLSALSGTLFLSLFRHQEPRFLIPAIPLILSSVRLPTSKNLRRYFLASWLVFNATFGILLGIYHQGGVIPTQLWLGTSSDNIGTVLWWKTYSPPVWLLDGNGRSVNTTDLMGMEPDHMIEQVRSAVIPCSSPDLGRNTDPISNINGKYDAGEEGATYLVAPYSALFLDRYIAPRPETEPVSDLRFEHVWTYRRHVNLDDVDFAGEGVWGSVKRVVGRRGLRVWRVRRVCGQVFGS